jgi:uncharacterized protein (TIGR03437 family)
VLLIVGSSPNALTAADVNLDGKLDLLVGSSENTSYNAVTVLLNQTLALGQPVVHVSAATYVSGGVAPGSIVSAFGAGLATGQGAAPSTELPLELAGARVRVRDAVGVERDQGLYFADPSHVNYSLDPATAEGIATVTITAADNTQAAQVEVRRVSPGLFFLNSNRLVAANVLRIRDGQQSFEDIGQIDSGTGLLVARPIDMGRETDRVFLILYGTGIRGRANVTDIRVYADQVQLPVTYAGPQGAYEGLDQVNVELPRSLIGRGEIEIVLYAGSMAANVVRAVVQ